MRVFFTLFCESVTEGTYGRINFEGVLPQKQIGIPHTDYLFSGYIVIVVPYEISKLKKTLSIRTPNATLDFNFDIPELPDDNLEKCIAIPINWVIKEYGLYSLDITFEDGLDAYTREFRIIHADASSLKYATEAIPPQIILGFNEHIEAQEWFRKIFRKARNKIIVIDNFWNTEMLLYLLSEIAEDIELALLVRSQNKQEAMKVIKKHINTKVFITDQIHDRYICLDNGAEVWHIGSSLNHAGVRIMTINKLTSIDAINKLKEKIAVISPNIF